MYAFSNYFFRRKAFRRLFWLVLILSIGILALRKAGQPLNQVENLNLKKNAPLVEEYRKANYVQAMDSLRRLYGKNKRLIKKYELQILLALSHYPELKEIAIHFYEQEAFIPLASRLEPASMFKSKEKWQYNIIISTESIDAFEPILLKNLPFNAQVGIIGHELAHTAFYQDKNVWQMLLIAFNYSFPEFRAHFEKNTDRRAITYGFGWQLLDYARYARKVMPYDETVLGSEYYLSPEEIEQQMAQTYGK